MGRIKFSTLPVGTSFVFAYELDWCAVKSYLVRVPGTDADFRRIFLPKRELKNIGRFLPEVAIFSKTGQNTYIQTDRVGLVINKSQGLKRKLCSGYIYQEAFVVPVHANESQDIRQILEPSI